MTDHLIGYVVIGGCLTGPTRMVRDRAAAHRLQRTWDRNVRRYYGGGYDALIAAVYRTDDGRCYVTAGGPGSGTGLAGMGLSGSHAVDRAIEWLRTRPKRWLHRHRITIS